MSERILIPLDGSETAEAILPHVHRYLIPHPGEAVLLQVVARHSPDFHFSVPGQHEEVTAYLRKRTFELEQSGIPARGRVSEGSPAEEILRASQAEQASMIALCTHGRTGLSRLVFGSVAEAVLRESTVPVFIVRASSFKGVSRGRLEALPFHHFLVPVDGSESSIQILPCVLRVARPVDSRVTLLHISPRDPYSPRWPSLDEAIRKSQAALTAACIPSTLEERKGEPAAEILRYCQEKKVDLVLMATHGRSGPPRWVLGSVTEEVLRSSSIPMIVVRRDIPVGEENPVPSDASAAWPPA